MPNDAEHALPGVHNRQTGQLHAREKDQKSDGPEHRRHVQLDAAGDFIEGSDQ
jgi:hypothetical protein